jgi:hypothetical protein
MMILIYTKKRIVLVMPINIKRQQVLVLSN